MEIFEVSPQGFCGGVINAIRIAEDTARKYPDTKITILGSLVHNSFVNRQLEELGLSVVEARDRTRLELLDEVDDGIVIFTAHGISDAVRKKAAEKGLQTIDASCRFVLSTQKIIQEKQEQGYAIFYIGKQGHPEAEGAITPDQNNYLIETAADIPDHVQGPVFVTNQTTMSVLDLQDLFDEIRRRYPDAEFCSEICTATRLRQQAVYDLKDRQIDLLIVIGDPKSNNTRKLSATGRKAGIPRVLQVESAKEINPEDLDGVNRVAVTSGASTPEFLKREVLDFLHAHQ